MAETTGSTSAPRGRPRDASTHNAIVEAANAILTKQGSSALSFERLAAKAGVSKASIYRRWSSKGELLLDLYMSEVADPPTQTYASFENALKDYLMLTVIRLETPWWAVAIRSLVAEAQADDTLASLVLQKVVKPRRKAVLKLLEMAKERKEIETAADNELLLDMIFGAMWYRLLLTHAPFDRQFIDDLVHSFIEMVGKK